MYNRTGHIRTEIGAGVLRTPWDVALTREGHVVVSDPGNHKVNVFSLRGDLIRSFSSCGTMTEPYAVTVNQHGQILVADRATRSVYIHSSGNYCKFSPNEAFLTKIIPESYYVYMYETIVQ